MTRALSAEQPVAVLPVRQPTAFDRFLGRTLRRYASIVGTYGLPGFSRLRRTVRYFSSRQSLLLADLSADSQFIIPLGDPYWSEPLLLHGGVYEPEIGQLLQRAAETPYFLIDCGANFGYWSILASSAAYGRHRVLAIEASRRSFDLLLNNARANGNRFTAVHYAVSNTAGETAKLYGSRHYSQSLRSDWGRKVRRRPRTEEVETITLDIAAARFLPDRSLPVIIKLDVEGLEVEAMQGASGLLNAGALVIYEDHGWDSAHAATRQVLLRGDMELWSLNADERPSRITALTAVAEIKAAGGSNFCAYRHGSVWAGLFTDDLWPEPSVDRRAVGARPAGSRTETRH